MDTVTDRIAELLQEATPKAAANLVEIAESAADKPTRKAARRALHLLAQRGVATPERAAVPIVPTPSRHSGGVTRAFASAFDGAGNRLVLLVLPDPDGGSPTMLQILVSDEEGIKDLFAQRVPRVQLEDRLARMAEQVENGLAIAEIEPDYARWLIAEYRAVNQRLRTATAPGFLEWLPRIGAAEQDYAAPPIYAHLPANEILEAPDIPKAVEDLFPLSWFQAWFLDMEGTEPWIMRMGEVFQSKIEMPEHVQKERVERVIGEATEALMDPLIRERYVRRLEETADVLRRRGKDKEARQALYHALELKSDRSVSDVPFARTLVSRTLAAVVQMYQEQYQAQKQTAR